MTSCEVCFMSSKIIRKINYLFHMGEDMTRLERNYLKECKEKQFIESIKGQKIDGKVKGKFRLTDTWKNFRKLFDKQVDPITLKKLPKRYNLHHLVLDPAKYTELDEDKFRPHSNSIHDLIHTLYGYYRKDKGVLDRIKEELDLMVELNDGKDVKDFLKD